MKPLTYHKSLYAECIQNPRKERGPAPARGGHKRKLGCTKDDLIGNHVLMNWYTYVDRQKSEPLLKSL